MGINVQVDKTGTENPLSLLRRFNKRTQGAGVINRVRKNRYQKRNQSPLSNKKHALNVLRRRDEVEHLIKLGKMVAGRQRKK